MLEDHMEPINHVLGHHLDQLKRELLLCLVQNGDICSALLPLYPSGRRVGRTGQGGRRPHLICHHVALEDLAFARDRGE